MVHKVNSAVFLSLKLYFKQKMIAEPVTVKKIYNSMATFKALLMLISFPTKMNEETELRSMTKGSIK